MVSRTENERNEGHIHDEGILVESLDFDLAVAEPHHAEVNEVLPEWAIVEVQDVFACVHDFIFWVSEHLSTNFVVADKMQLRANINQVTLRCECLG